nr:5-beta-cholestane-3-alpha,7-alpha-diol 12-alpha-hydroxylase isoform X2 [Equus caballus]
MVLWVPVLGVLLVAIVGYLCVLGLLRQRRPQEPPLDKGSIPWLGHAVAFRKNMFEFLKHMWAKHGDVFTVQLGGQYFTFVMDPLSFGPILKDAQRKLDFVEYAEKLVLKVFGYHSVQGDHRMIHSASTKHLMGDGLEDLNKVMLDSLSLVILGPTGRSPDASCWREDGLFHFCYDILFKAGYLSLFGYTKDKEQDLLQAEELFIHFRKFDCLFPRFVYSLLWPREWLEVGRLQRLFHKTLSVKHNLEKDGISNWISYMLQFLREQEVAPAMQDKFNFMMLWASQGNTGPTSFWALLFLLKHPEAMRAVRKEATRVLGEARLEARQSFNFKVRKLRPKEEEQLVQSVHSGKQYDYDPRFPDEETEAWRVEAQLPMASHQQMMDPGLDGPNNKRLSASPTMPWTQLNQDPSFCGLFPQPLPALPPRPWEPVTIKHDGPGVPTVPT